MPTQVSLLVETLNLSMSLRNIGHFLLCQKKVALNSSNDITGMLAVLLKDIKVTLTDSVWFSFDLHYQTADTNILSENRVTKTVY